MNNTVLYYKQPYFIFAVGMIVGFFLPWGQLLGIGVSGYQLTTLGSYGNLAWVVPSLAVLVLVLGLHESRYRSGMAVIAGLVPWLALFYGITEVGIEIFHGLAIGAYIILLCGAVLLILGVGD